MKTAVHPPCTVDATPVHDAGNSISATEPGPWLRATNEQRVRAALRLRVVDRFDELVAAGLSRMQSTAQACRESGVSSGNLSRWRKRVRGLAGPERVAALLDAPGRGRKPDTWKGPGADELWTQWCTDYLRAEAPDATDVYERIVERAGKDGWEIPTLIAFRRRTEREVPMAERVRARQGAIAAMDLAPHQTRTVADLAPLDIVNGDGKIHDVVVVFPSGREGRPVTWVWQDVYSRRILAWATGETESSALIRRSLHEVITRHGVPGRVVLDNTRAASAKDLTGGQGARKRNRAAIPADELPGIFQLLGIGYSNTSVDTDAAGRGVGRGRAKPVERAFRDLMGWTDKHPRLAGAYTGSSPQDRPETHRQKAADWQTFLEVLADGVRKHNARIGRRTEAAAGRSFDQAWAEGIAGATVRRITEKQARVVLLSPEPVRVARDGTVTLRAGAVPHRPANRYHHADLLERAGEQLVARYDPDRLHDPIHLYDDRGRWICEAECLMPVGWRDTASAREYNRLRRQTERHARRSVESRRDMDALLERSVGEEEATEDHSTEWVRPAAVRMVNGPELPAAPGAPRSTNKLLAALRRVQQEEDV